MHANTREKQRIAIRVGIRNETCARSMPPARALFINCFRLSQKDAVPFPPEPGQQGLRHHPGQKGPTSATDFQDKIGPEPVRPTAIK